MTNEKPTSVRLNKEELELISKASKIAFDKDKHRKNYAESSFIKESALNRAKRLVAKANK